MFHFPFKHPVSFVSFPPRWMILSRRESLHNAGVSRSLFMAPTDKSFRRTSQRAGQTADGCGEEQLSGDCSGWHSSVGVRWLYDGYLFPASGMFYLFAIVTFAGPLSMSDIQVRLNCLIKEHSWRKPKGGHFPLHGMGWHLLINEVCHNSICLSNGWWNR